MELEAQASGRVTPGTAENRALGGGGNVDRVETGGAPDQGVLKKGDMVEGNWMNQGKWYPGKVLMRQSIGPGPLTPDPNPDP